MEYPHAILHEIGLEHTFSCLWIINNFNHIDTQARKHGHFKEGGVSASDTSRHVSGTRPNMSYYFFIPRHLGDTYIHHLGTHEINYKFEHNNLGCKDKRKIM